MLNSYRHKLAYDYFWHQAGMVQCNMHVNSINSRRPKLAVSAMAEPNAMVLHVLQQVHRSLGLKGTQGAQQLLVGMAGQEMVDKVVREHHHHTAAFLPT